MSENKEATFEIEKPVEEVAKEFDTEGLSPEELELAVQHDLVKDKEEDKEDKKEEDKDDKKEDEDKDKDEHKEQSKDESKDDSEEEKPKTFEEVEKDEGKLKKFNPNEQALYWKYKSDKKKRQSAQRDAEEWKAKFELGLVKDKGKIGKISKALEVEGITVEELQKIIGNKPEDDDTPITRAELNKIEEARELKEKEIGKKDTERNDKIETATNIGYSKYGKEEFEELTRITTEFVNTPEGKTYKMLLEASFNDIDVSEEQVVDQVATIAKLSPKYGKKSLKKEDEKKEDTDIDRAIKNSKKKTSSAAVGKSGKVTVSEDDLTVDDADTMTTAQWNRLKESTRERLLQS